MPRILVMSNARDEREGAITLDERIGSAELESAHRSAELIERVGWAVPMPTRTRRSPVGRSATDREARDLASPAER